MPHEIIGRVVNIRPGASCTLSVAYVGATTKIYFTHNSCEDQIFRCCFVEADIEYGDTKGFVKIG